MKTLRKGSFDSSVSFLKRLLNRAGYPVAISSDFDNVTFERVRQFQRANSLVVDGVVGKNTWEKLMRSGYDFSWGTNDYILEDDEWMNEYTEKDTIYLHHTAGLHRPDYTIGWWENDNKPGTLNRVGTSFVIGRKSLEGDYLFDGVTYRAFNEMFWAHHLGTKLSNNKQLNQKSIGIEICSLGHLKKSSNGQFYFQGNSKKIVVPESEVCQLNTPWRGHRYFQKYTDKQIKECERLILTLATIFDIPIKNLIYDSSWFDIKEEAQNGAPGIWTHCNVRTDKTDCFPQPEFIEMLNGLHTAYQNFELDYSELEAESSIGAPNELNKAVLQNYTKDLELIDN
ncbi:peptidoglycan-binding protein [Pseudozobellia sp. WGM2]|uniref:peptidoglycan recognition protein family protein n=1 Tax=Pseudozobellia sp. WGM2 TaxID=2787625 RepID=UPI001ADFC773|nr:peptidoglycan-binding protein [Pseudozobellia sp. WGM2]